MLAQPVLDTERLTLRPFTLADAPEVRRLAGDWNIASTTARIPHPYPEGAAEAWISRQPGRFARGEEVVFAIVRRADGLLVGCIGLVMNGEDEGAELGYWIGHPYWNLGYATEAGIALLKYGFMDLGLNGIDAVHLNRNPASGRVIEKLGMRPEGRLRQHSKRWGAFEDLECRGILRSEFQAAN